MNINPIERKIKQLLIITVGLLIILLLTMVFMEMPLFPLWLEELISIKTLPTNVIPPEDGNTPMPINEIANQEKGISLKKKGVLVVIGLGLIYGAYKFFTS